MNHFLNLRGSVVTGLLALLVIQAAIAAAEPVGSGAAPSETLFRNVRIYDGKGSSLSAPTSVLVRGNRIAAIGAATAAAEATAIEGNGRTLMPGLIDAHWHAMMV